ncbi:MAG: hypothetical protein U0401_34750 [Anaerolineae bacterium]
MHTVISRVQFLVVMASGNIDGGGFIYFINTKIGKAMRAVAKDDVR